MMEVIKVIVDKLPCGCEDCHWMQYDGYCVFTNKATGEPDELPDLCPLMTEEENIEQVLNRLDGEPKRYLYDESEE